MLRSDTCRASDAGFASVAVGRSQRSRHWRSANIFAHRQSIPSTTATPQQAALRTKYRRPRFDRAA